MYCSHLFYHLNVTKLQSYKVLNKTQCQPKSGKDKLLFTAQMYPFFTKCYCSTTF